MLKLIERVLEWIVAEPKKPADNRPAWMRDYERGCE